MTAYDGFSLRSNSFYHVYQPGSGGVRLLALKFVQAVILLYTPDPNGSQEPPAHEGNLILHFNSAFRFRN